jgi:hypothetical protein
MALIATLVDNFNDNIIGPDWGNAYGGCTETGGRAHIPCIAGNYSGYQTAKVWTLAGSSVYLQVPTAAAAASATVEAQTAFSVINVTDGTNLAFNINTVAGTLRLESNVAYSDAGATVLTYSAVTHLWLRFREDGTNVYWDTSTDGSTWTNRRTLATPAWITAGTTRNTCALDLYSYRNNGTTNFTEFDNVNTPGSTAATFFAAAALTSDTTLAAAATARTIVTADLTTDAALSAAAPAITAMAGAALTGNSTLTAALVGATIDVDVQLGHPVSGWAVSRPWR